MRFTAYSLAAASALLSFGSASPIDKRQNTYAGYLISTFSDVNPTVQWYLSNDNSPTSFTKINGGNAVLTSTVGTKAVRDVYLAANGARDQFYLIATGKCEDIRYLEVELLTSMTDLDINAAGFSWDEATRRGSRGIVVWSSSNLVDWSAASLNK